jgi:hypothetical protein
VVEIISAIVILVITAKVGHTVLRGRRRGGGDVLPAREA